MRTVQSSWIQACTLACVCLAGCNPRGTVAPPTTPGPPASAPSGLRLYVLPIDGTPVSLTFLRDHDIELVGQLPGNHAVYPHGVLLYLSPEEIPRLRGLGVYPIDASSTPEARVLHSHLSGCDHPVPASRYCEYADPAIHARCANETIVSKLQAYDAAPPRGGADYVALVTLAPLTLERGLAIHGVRIGARANEGGVPQVVVAATQHAREWVTTEAAMSLIDHYVRQYAIVGSPEHSALQDVVLTVVPVMNPDGYEFGQTSYREPPPEQADVVRLWRPTRAACSEDPNRNFPFSRGQPGGGTACFRTEGGSLSGVHSTYHGTTTMAETSAAIALLTDARFPTALLVNVHAFGQMVLFTDGVSAAFSPCTTNSNCSHPDLAVQAILGGTLRSPRFTDLETRLPYRAGPVYRTLYEASGDLASHAHMDLGVMSMSLEIGRGTCAFAAETRHDDLNVQPANELQAMIADWLLLAPRFHNGTVYDTHALLGAYVLPHLHRRSAAGDGVAEHPTLRVGGRKQITAITVLPSNEAEPAFTDFNDSVLAGVGYKSFRWRPAGDPFVFPRQLQVCSAETNCQTVALEGERPEIDLCDAAAWTGDGWAHQGRGPDAATVQDQCYFYLTGRGSGLVGAESNVWTLTGVKNLSSMTRSHLSFSYDRSTRTGIDLTIKASRSGTFDPCDASTGCRTAYATRPPYVATWDGSGMRTEVVDLSDFDGQVVHLRWELRDVSPIEREVKVYDPVVVGFLGR